jgi:hypothetical protein
VGNHKVIISIENVKNVEPRTNYSISFSPLTRYLKMMNTGIEEHITKKKISHLLYMEDLRLTGKTVEGCKKLQTVKIFSYDIHTKLWLENV